MVPSSKVGLVIGKGGETIKSINQASGAHTEIDKSAPPDAVEKNFIIRGPPECVDRAKQMVMEKIGLIQVSNFKGQLDYALRFSQQANVPFKSCSTGHWSDVFSIPSILGFWLWLFPWTNI